MTFLGRLCKGLIDGDRFAEKRTLNEVGEHHAVLAGLTGTDGVEQPADDHWLLTLVCRLPSVAGALDQARDETCFSGRLWCAETKVGCKDSHDSLCRMTIP